MNKERDHTPFDKQITSALRATEPKRTPNCLEPEEFLLMIDNPDDPALAPMVAHATECPYCRREYVGMRKTFWEAERLRNAPMTAESEFVLPTSQRPTAEEASPSWWQVWRWPVFSLRWAVGLALAPAMATLLLAYVVGIRPLQDQKAALNSQLAQQRTERTELARRLAQQAQASKTQLAQATQEKESVLKQMEAKLQGTEAQARALQKRLIEQGSQSVWSEQELAKLEVTKAQLMELTAHKAIMGDDSNAKTPPLQPISPVATRIQENRPTLRWKPFAGATRYTVTVTTYPDYKPVCSSEALSETEWRVPKSLSPNATYVWQVVASQGDETTTLAQSPETRFQIMEKAKAGPLDALRLRLGATYAKAGLFDEAAREFSAIPENSLRYADAQRRLREIETRRGE